MNSVAVNKLRYDLQVIASWIPRGSRVLGLGCGEGDLLYHLKTHKQAACTGIEIDEAKVAAAISRGLTVLQGDINVEVQDYPDRAFDVVVLSQTLQQIYEPAELIASMLRIGDRCIVSFPNFSHWAIRLQLLLTGRAPVSPQLPYGWHDTPNIRVITLKDFRGFARDNGFKIYQEMAINTDKKDYHGILVNWLSDLRATYGLFMIGKESAEQSRS